MEGMVKQSLFDGIYRDRKVVVTGHTGFKGSWLVLWLKSMGAEVTGIALDPDTTPNHWTIIDQDIADHRFDIGNVDSALACIQSAEPDIVFHLAAQPLVRASYREPVNTWSTNVMGTVSLLEACRATPSVKAIVVVTSDKCYDNRGLDRGYKENDPLGGYDPYSASKAAAELVAASYRSSFFQREHGALLATARAGNVIGGGDWAEDRLIPDLYRAVETSDRLEIRSPNATRPWQHVLDALAGYLLLGQQLLEGEGEAASAWNFGPDIQDNCRVVDVLEQMKVFWPEISWSVSRASQPHEAALLQLDSNKARKKLCWHPVWDLQTSLRMTAQWYAEFLLDGEVCSSQHLNNFVADAVTREAVWACR